MAKTHSVSPNNTVQPKMSTDAAILAREYITSWRLHDRARLDAVLADDCQVVESDGTEYSSRTAILQWLDQWIASGSKVEGWEICSILV